jgi:hypothetical protein
MQDGSFEIRPCLILRSVRPFPCSPTSHISIAQKIFALTTLFYLCSALYYDEPAFANFYCLFKPRYFRVFPCFRRRPHSDSVSLGGPTQIQSIGGSNSERYVRERGETRVLEIQSIGGSHSDSVEVAKGRIQRTHTIPPIFKARFAAIRVHYEHNQKATRPPIREWFGQIIVPYPAAASDSILYVWITMRFS